MSASYSSHVFYTDGYRYKTETAFMIKTGIIPIAPGGNDFVKLDVHGLLTISSQYAWDGASGPAINTLNFIRGSLVHDALYQLIREGVLTSEQRDQADRLLVKLTREDGMSALRCWWVYTAVSLFGGLFMVMKKAEWKVAPPLYEDEE